MSPPEDILGEIRKYREEHAASFNYDVNAIVEDLIRQQEEAKAAGKVFVNPPAKHCLPSFPFTPMDLPASDTSISAVE